MIQGFILLYSLSLVIVCMARNKVKEKAPFYYGQFLVFIFVPVINSLMAIAVIHGLIERILDRKG